MTRPTSTLLQSTDKDQKIKELSSRINGLKTQLDELRNILQLNGHLLDLLEEKYNRLLEQTYESTVD